MDLRLPDRGRRQRQAEKVAKSLNGAGSGKPDRIFKGHDPHHSSRFVGDLEALSIDKLAEPYNFTQEFASACQGFLDRGVEICELGAIGIGDLIVTVADVEEKSGHVHHSRELVSITVGARDLFRERPLAAPVTSIWPIEVGTLGRWRS